VMEVTMAIPIAVPSRCPVCTTPPAEPA
jgi:hypothetical protein